MPLVIRSVSKVIRNKAAVFAAAAGALVFAAGCGSGGEPDLERGRALFIEKCGTCHALAEAATTANIGPNLDAAFYASREAGMDSDTVKGVTLDQIRAPRVVRENEPNFQQQYMPANIVTGQDAQDVAAYVASVAGVPGIEPPVAEGGPGAQVFAENGCAACHTLEAAGATGTVGPNLDETLPGQNKKQVHESLVDPNAVVVAGFPANTMPSYADLDEQALQDLIDFLLESAGNGGS